MGIAYSFEECARVKEKVALVGVDKGPLPQKGSFALCLRVGRSFDGNALNAPKEKVLLLRTAFETARIRWITMKGLLEVFESLAFSSRTRPYSGLKASSKIP